ncbi:MAG: hypothetical protein RTU30_02920 [Candidatus Thorarchaeota archaeon]
MVSGEHLEVVQDYAPILHFHPDEGDFCCYPSDAEVIFKNFSNNWDRFEVDMTPKTLDADTPCYYEVWNDERMLQIRYWFWYNYNRFPGAKFGKGNHLGDWEHIEVRIYRDQQQQSESTIWLHSNHLIAFLNSLPSHLTLSGFEAEPLILSDNQIHTWVALGSHAHYPTPNTKPRCFARIFCDKIAPDGEVWNTKQNLVSLQDTVFSEFTGRWGDEKAPRSPTNAYNNRWRNAPNLQPIVIRTSS